MTECSVSERVLAWYDRHGRHDLPWKQQPTPYRVWVSEIMLQQTRVETVKVYYRRFLDRFAHVAVLADAPVDEVLHLWSGLGYYARARNLHRAAGILHGEYEDRFPQDIEQLQALPGIGRSTAGAILALSYGQRHPILDGNVKRVLARYHALAGWPGHSQVLRTMWHLAESHTPRRRVADYTQAMMDLGSMVCVRIRPLCSACPLRSGCEAHRAQSVARYPSPRPKRELPVRAVRMLMISDNGGRVLLSRRPPTGVWGGLWSFPECAQNVDIASWCEGCLGVRVRSVGSWEPIRHTFSHFHMDIIPVHLQLVATGNIVMDRGVQLWYNPRQPQPVGLAAPVARLLAALGEQDQGEYDGADGEMCEAG